MGDSSDEDPVELRENAELCLLPEKSRAKYMKAFDVFNIWWHNNGAKTLSETVILSYFDELAQSKKPSTLWSIFSMLKATLKLKKNVHIERYPKLMAFLKRTSAGHVPKKSKTFTAADITKFLNEAPDSKHLGTKVALIIGISGACRTQELTYLMTNQVEKHSERLLLFKLPDTKTNIERNFVVRDEYVEIVKKYQNLRPPKTATDRFFLGYRKGKCIKQPMGSNKIGSLPQEIATFLGLTSPEQYTGHCFRRTSATLLADSGADLMTLKRHGGWKSSTVAEGHLEDSIKNKSKICKGTTSNPHDPLSIEQCRFCGEFNAECVKVTSDKPYLVHNRMAITLNGLSVDLDFNTLPNAVCPHCDEKLHDIYKFVNRVKEAQDNLINVEANREEINIKIEALSPTPEDDKEGSLDLFTVGETEFVKPVFTRKRKNDNELTKPKDKVVEKKLKVTEKNVELFIDVKEEVEMDENTEEQIENSEAEMENCEFSDTGTDVKPSELELNSALRNKFSDSFS